MTLTFAECLQTIRAEKGITQQQALDTLIKSEVSLSKLDLTTYSRWERGVTKPKLSKQILIARILGANAASLINPETKIPENKRQVLNYVHSRAKDPYSKPSDDFTAYRGVSLRNREDILQKIVTFHTDYLQHKLQSTEFLNDNLHVDIFVDCDNKLIGHMIYGYVERNTSPTLLNPNNLAKCPFLGPDKRQGSPLALYIVSMYCSLIAPRMITILSVIELLRQSQNIKDLYVNVHDQEGFNLYNSNVDCAILAKGEQEPYGGIKVYGKHYRYVQVKANAEEILASKVIADLVPFADHYLADLLDASDTNCPRS